MTMNNLNKNKLIYFTDKVKSLENAILNQAKILTDITEILDEEIAVNKNSSCVTSNSSSSFRLL